MKAKGGEQLNDENKCFRLNQIRLKTLTSKRKTSWLFKCVKLNLRVSRDNPSQWSEHD